MSTPKMGVEKIIGIDLGTTERGIDPMECVAVGAAIQGAILTGVSKDLLLPDR